MSINFSFGQLTNEVDAEFEVACGEVGVTSNEIYIVRELIRAKNDQKLKKPLFDSVIMTSV